jgi:hypothetical protein
VKVAAPKPVRVKRTKAPSRAKARACRYVPGHSSAICPDCWSRPSIKGRIELDTLYNGWGVTLTDETQIVDGTTYRVAKMFYPCSNPDCATIIETRWLFGPSTPITAGRLLTAAEAKAYKTGALDPALVWRDASGKAKTDAPPPKVKKRGT